MSWRHHALKSFASISADCLAERLGDDDPEVRAAAADALEGLQAFLEHEDVRALQGVSGIETGARRVFGCQIGRSGVFRSVHSAVLFLKVLSSLSSSAMASIYENRYQD